MEEEYFFMTFRLEKILKKTTKKLISGFLKNRVPPWLEGNETAQMFYVLFCKYDISHN